MKNKKALSTVIATVIIILLTVAAIAIVWTFVRNMINDQKGKVESCFDVESSEKVYLNGMYTCYINETVVPGDPGLDSVQFSINLADVEIESLVISIEAGGESKSFTLNNTPTSKTNMKPYGPSTEWGDVVSLPEANAGKTYVVQYETDALSVDLIRIAPIIGTEQCGVTDQISQVANCELLG